jgi:hypothetical protein
MNQRTTSLASLALLLAAISLPTQAASSTASSASDSASSATSSASDSLKTSSNGSSKATTAVTDGDYKVIEVAALTDRPGTVRIKLQAVADPGADSEFFLYLPQQIIDKSSLGAGHIVAARQRPYGVEFARGDTRQAFFLVLDDAAYRDLKSNAVVL